MSGDYYQAPEDPPSRHRAIVRITPPAFLSGACLMLVQSHDEFIEPPHQPALCQDVQVGELLPHQVAGKGAVI